jgi:DNA-binding transcriptional MerR regulator
MAMTQPDSPFTIAELAAQAAAALAAQPVGRFNGRIREIADVRTLRYYTTLGLLDRPSRWVGRTAYYGQRHLLQLVSIKRLQAKGQSLAKIQARLLNASSEELARLAELPAEIPSPTSIAESAERVPAPAESEPAHAFWKVRPAAQAAAEQPASEAGRAQPVKGEGSMEILIDPRLALLLTAARPPDNEDLAALRVAALPLLDVLRKRRLLS